MANSQTQVAGSNPGASANVTQLARDILSPNDDILKLLDLTLGKRPALLRGLLHKLLQLCFCSLSDLRGILTSFG
ncbi:MAG: hypothetical protein NTZ14_00230, partial [Hyphomicrobiales bacterium]|nr:hypothetical protein [Hyphomicrobiales bacterium]